MEDPVALAKAAVEGFAQEAANDIELILERVASVVPGPGLHGSDRHAVVDAVLTLREKIDGVIDQLAQRVTAANDPLAVFKGWLVAQPAGRQDQILGAEVGAAFRSDPSIKILLDWQGRPIETWNGSAKPQYPGQSADADAAVVPAVGSTPKTSPAGVFGELAAAWNADGSRQAPPIREALRPLAAAFEVLYPRPGTVKS
jgi:hypothetical protein